MTKWLTDISLVVATLLTIALLLREDLKRNEKIFLAVVGVAYFICLFLLCKQIYDLSQFPAMQ